MINLLSAEFSRLFKNKLLWALSAFVTGFGVFETVMQYIDSRQMGTVSYLDNTLFAYVLVIGGCGAVFCSMFIGTDYQDGTIRNKLVVGHRREQMYLCTYVISVCASVVMMALYFAVQFTLGIALLGKPAMGVSQLLVFIGIGMLTIAAFDALYVLISMLIPSRSSAAVACLLVFFGLIIVAAVINGMLDAPEYIQEYSMSVNGVELSEPQPNPRYLSGMKREFYQFLYDFLPTGQGIQLVSCAVLHPIRLALCSLGITAASVLGGICVFRNEDIK